MFLFRVIPAFAIVAVLAVPTVGLGQEKKLPRVLILGDSISLGYTEAVKKRLAGVAVVSRPKENCQHTAYGLTRIKTWLGDEKWDVIHFNWGIWDTHMLGPTGALVRDESKSEGKTRIRHTSEQYRGNMEKLVDAMEKTGAKLIFATTTPIMSRSGARFDDIKNHNAAAEALMKSRKFAINDLYSYVLPNAKEWQSGDKVHFNAVGNDRLARQVSNSIRESLGLPAESKK